MLSHLGNKALSWGLNNSKALLRSEASHHTAKKRRQQSKTLSANCQAVAISLFPLLILFLILQASMCRRQNLELVVGSIPPLIFMLHFSPIFVVVLLTTFLYVFVWRLVGLILFTANLFYLCQTGF